jgi:hypothetical protein
LALTTCRPLFNLYPPMVEWWRVLCRKFRDVRVRERDKRDKTPSYFGGLLCHLPQMGEDGVVSYLQVGERESERSTLITDRREK